VPPAQIFFFEPLQGVALVLIPKATLGPLEVRGTIRGSSEIGDRFETSFVPRYITPPFGLILPSSSDPGSDGWQRCNNTSSL